MKVGIEMVVLDGMTGGEHDMAMSMTALEGVLRLLAEASREEEGERYMALVNAAHDFGSAMFLHLRRIKAGVEVRVETMDLLTPLMEKAVVQ